MKTKELTAQTLIVQPITHALNASVRVPGSKSQTNRALLIAALADGITRLNNALFSDDSLYLVNALQKLGFTINLNPKTHQMTMIGLGGKIPITKASLFIGNAGTAARFMTAFLSLAENGTYRLDGEARMRERPLEDLVNALERLGAHITPTREGMESIFLPIEVSASGLKGGQTSIAGDVSSQFLSALLMTAPYAPTTVEVEITTDLKSKPYVDMTIDVMREFGVEVDREGYRKFRVKPGCYEPQGTYTIESDASAASYFFAAPALCGGTVRVENINRRSKQGDLRFLDVLAEMGCKVVEEQDAISVTGPQQLKGVTVDMGDFPDTAQTLAALAPFAETPTHISGIASARMKETDRIAAVCTELERLGVHVDEHDDGMTIYPTEKIRPAVIRTYNDHRMAMAFTLIGLKEQGIKIEDPGCVSKTFPNFFKVLDRLR